MSAESSISNVKQAPYVEKMIEIIQQHIEQHRLNETEILDEINNIQSGSQEASKTVIITSFVDNALQIILDEITKQAKDGCKETTENLARKNFLNQRI